MNARGEYLDLSETKQKSPQWQTYNDINGSAGTKNDQLFV